MVALSLMPPFPSFHPSFLPFPPPPSILHLSLERVPTGITGGPQSFLFDVCRHILSIGATVRPQMSRPNKACCIVETKENTPKKINKIK